MLLHKKKDKRDASSVSPEALNAAARRLGLTPIGSQNLALSGGRLVHFRITNGQVADAVRCALWSALRIRFEAKHKPRSHQDPRQSFLDSRVKATAFVACLKEAHQRFEVPTLHRLPIRAPRQC